MCDPYHLVICFELFSHTLALGHLEDKQVHPSLTGLIHLQQMRIQFSRQQQLRKNHGTLFF